jgi:XTP/dITP diphosphohydrolase
LLTQKSTILLATGNARKAGEMRSILTPLLPQDIRLVTLTDIGLDSPPDEIEVLKTFPGNARVKAIWCAQHSGCPSIADDSGICVDALGGAPGVRSARWAGPDATDRNRCELLLAELERVGAILPEQRLARFVCACVLATPNAPKQTICRMGSIRGRILFEPQGSGGFGYDPLFYLRSHHSSMAALGRETKNKISHRARALRSLAKIIPHDMQ